MGNMRRLSVKIGVIFILTWFGATPCFASDLIRLGKDLHEVAIDSKVDYLEDKEGRLQIEEVASPRYEHEWRPNLPANSNFGFTTSAYWLRFRVSAAHKEQGEWFLNIDYPPLDTIAYYRPVGSAAYDKKVTGDRYPFAQRELVASSYLFSFDAGLSNERYHYLRVESTGSIFIPLSILSPAGLVDHRFRDDVWLASFFGVFFAILIYNILLFISLKDVAYGYFFLSGLMMVLYQGTIEGVTFQFLWPELPSWNETCLPFAIAQVVLWTTMVCDSFLQLKRDAPLLHRSTLALAAICILTSISSFIFNYSLVMAVSMVLVVVVSVCLNLIALYRYFYQKYQPGRLMVVGVGAFLVGPGGYVLKSMALLPANFITENLLPICTVAEFVLISLALNDRLAFVTHEGQKKLTKLNSEVQRHIEEMQKSVAARTRTIQAMIDHIYSGIFMVGPSGQIFSGFTRSCRNLFPTMAEGQQFVDILQLSAARKEFVADAVNQVFMDMMPEQVTIAMIPRKYQVNNKTIELSGSVVRNDQGAIESIIFTAVDTTHLTHIEQEAETHRTLVGIVSRRTSFATFLVDTKAQIDYLYQEITAIADSQIRQIIHTIKGNSSLYGIHEAVELANEIENKDVIVTADLNGLERCFERFLFTHYSVLHLKWGDEKNTRYSVPKSAFMTLAQTVSQPERLAVEPDFVRSWVDQIRNLPAAHYLGPIYENVRRLSAKVTKKVRLEIIGGETPFYFENIESIMLSLPHLIRNAIYHGIESDRKSAGKDEVGTITLAFGKSASHHFIRISDDGCGLDVNHVAAHALRHNLVSEGELHQMNEKEKVELIFRSGFSTAGTVTDIAGRGVGLTAVMQCVKAQGGTLHVNSAAGMGTTFEISIPIRSVSPALSSVA
jgi:two-component sensor histidine kinase